MTRFGRLRRFLLLTPTSLAIAAVVLALADWGSWMASDSFFPGGPLDELAHLLTTVLVLWALGRSACRRFLVPAAIASVAIDLDHVPGRLGAQFLTEGTPRPYTHSLLTIAVMLVAALLLRRHRDVLLGIALGLAVHFFRDLSEPRSGVALLWPWSDHSFSLPHGTYAGAMAAVVMFDAYRLYATKRVRTKSLGLPASEPLLRLIALPQSTYLRARGRCRWTRLRQREPRPARLESAARPRRTPPLDR